MPTKLAMLHRLSHHESKAPRPAILLIPSSSMELVAQGKLSPDKFASHHFRLDTILDAYDTFGRAAETRALKVVISR